MANWYKISFKVMPSPQTPLPQTGEGLKDYIASQYFLAFLSKFK